MLKLKILSLLLLCYVTGFTQYKVSGIIVNDNLPLDLASVNLLVNDSIKEEVFTNQKGEFSFVVKAQAYDLKIMYLGELIFKDHLDIVKDINLGIIKVQKTISLKEISITGRKKVIERKIDRLVFNLERSISSAGGDAIDALKITPGVRIRGDKINLVGKDRLQVMIDDKFVTLSGENLNSFLRSISSDNISSIEVITTPPAKYEAEGNSGIINIRLKKNNIDSWNAAIGSSYTQRTYGTASAIGSLNYKSKKLTLYSNLNALDGSKSLLDYNEIYYPDQQWTQNNPRKVGTNSIAGRIGLDYDLTKNWTIGLQYLGSKSNLNINESPLTVISNYTNQNPDGFISSTSNTRTHDRLNSFNFSNTIKLDSSGNQISINADYFKYTNSDSRNFSGNQLNENSSIIHDSYFASINNNDQKITNYAFKADMEQKLKWINLEFGYKYSRSHTDNTIVFFDNKTGVPEIDPKQSNQFKYSENINSAYLSGSREFGKKWETKFGLRMENTESSGFSFNNNQENKNNYIKLFPSTYISYKPTENQSFFFTYSRRIDRPKYEQVNPFRMYDSPYMYTEGNPFLQPSFTNNFDFVYTYKQLESKLYYSHLTNGFEQIGIVDPNTKITRFFVDNFLTTNRYGISETFTYDAISWWTSTNNVDFNYVTSKSINPSTQKKRNGYNAYFSSNNDFTINKKKTLVLSLNYWYSLPGITGLDQVSSANSLSLAIKAYLLHKKLQLTVAGNDIFKGERYSITSYTNDTRIVYKNYYDNRSLRFTLSYKFGNQKIKVKSKETGNEEEKNRTNK
jgi:outer membrane receptor protein involved in Fe transport